jgi:acyl-CoA dehydrogenase
MGAVVRALQMSGALEAILEIAVSYANERIAFARPIAKFQAVQHNLARLAGETAAAVAAAASAADSLANAGTPAAGARKIDPEDAVLLEVAAAKIRVGEAAGVGAGIAHQVLGAIGFTREHVLHRFTQRLWAWRDDFDNESAWAVRLGTMIAAHGGDALWPLLASR